MKYLSIYISICCWLFAGSLIGQTNWFVKSDAPATGAGSDWNSATSLSKALDMAVDGDIIHLTAGIYVPEVLLTNGTEERDKCFEIKSNITLKGGYSAITPEQHPVDPVNYKTVLSGNLGSENAYHVIAITAPKTAGRSVTLQGITIRDGVCNGTGNVTIGESVFSRNYGAGLFATNANIDLIQCWVTNNQGTANVGCWFKNVHLNMSDSEFSKNTALNGQTGGMYLFSSVLNMERCKVAENVCTKGNATGLYLYSSKGVINESVISNNEASGVAAGIQLYSSAYLYLYNSTVSGNKAGQTAAGGIYVRTKSYLQVCNSTIFGNTVGKGGNAGAIALHDASRVDVISSTITGNTSSDPTKTGGIYLNVGCYASLYNTILSGNAPECGGITANVTVLQSITGDSYSNRAGKSEKISFDAATMLGTLADNGGITPTCQLTGVNNPAANLGLTMGEMIELGSRYAFPGFLIGKDQRGKIRNPERVSIGAYQDVVGDAPVLSADFWHLIMYGQSLGDGYQSYPSLSAETVDGNYMIGNQVYIANANQNFTSLSPLFASPALYDVQRNYVRTKVDGVRCENPLVGAANHIQQKLKTPTNILATSCAVSGKTIEQLSKHSKQPTVYYDDYLKTLSSGLSIREAQKLRLTCPAIFFMQGEYNYFPEKPGLLPESMATTDKEEYKALLRKLKTDMQEDAVAYYGQSAKPLFITYQTGGQYLRGFEEKISMAQLEAANADEDMVCAGPVYPMTDRGGHLDPNGYRWYGEMLGKVFYRTVLEGTAFKPLQPLKIVRLDDNTLKITFYVPYKPLVLDTQITEKVKDFGFAMRDGNGELELVLVDLDPDQESVILKASRNFVGDVEVNYAGEGVKGHGNLRDSDPYESLYTYQDLDAKEEDQYVYPRDTEDSLRPSYEPQDENGAIYGKKYPLYNFCTHFYYQLPANSSAMDVPDLDDVVTGICDKNIANAIKLTYLSDNEFMVSGDWDFLTMYALNGTVQMTLPHIDLIRTDVLQPGLYLVEVKKANKTLTFKYLK